MSCEHNHGEEVKQNQDLIKKIQEQNRELQSKVEKMGQKSSDSSTKFYNFERYETNFNADISSFLMKGKKKAAPAPAASSAKKGPGSSMKKK